MRKIHVPDIRLFDNQTSQFVTAKGGDLVIEHSLLSVYKWESKWKKSFLSRQDKTIEEQIDYIRCMVVDGYIDPLTYYYLPGSITDQIEDYINEPMTATTFRKTNEKPSKEIVTAEIIYWQMIMLGIPIEFESRHLNHLLTLIKVCSIKNGPKKKTPKQELLRSYREINAANKAKYNTKG